mmetsp:Transcript_10851/g.16682  ORF Transcript_10851/g.16682 Transcript_10851/m.16682 type:complete len:332 (+) Transcript_10851:79-1074(+)
MISRACFALSIRQSIRNPTSCCRRGFETATRSSTQKLPRVEKPGAKAFAAVESAAVMDLFYSHAKGKDHLNRDEIGNVLQSIGQKPTPKLLDDFFKVGDLNGDGVISLHEFLASADTLLGKAPARIVMVVGGPGSGKGMLCKRLEDECHVVHLSSGDLLRQEVQADTVLGREVADIMKRGELVSSALIVALMQRRMRDHPGKRVLLDGFPRSLENATDLVELCGKPEMALHLWCDDTVMLERILSRGEGRADDNIQTALQRIRTYHKYHNQTMDWLRDQSVPVVNLDCSGTPEQIWDQLLALGRLMRPACHLSTPTTEEDPTISLLPSKQS